MDANRPGPTSPILGGALASTRDLDRVRNRDRERLERVLRSVVREHQSAARGDATVGEAGVRAPCISDGNHFVDEVAKVYRPPCLEC